VYKKLDEAYLGHESAKRWVMNNLHEVINYIDEIKNEVGRLATELYYCEKGAEEEEQRLNAIIREQEYELNIVTTKLMGYEEKERA
jgi:sugar-specific transcriptional regulator TrmB